MLGTFLVDAAGIAERLRRAVQDLSIPGTENHGGAPDRQHQYGVLPPAALARREKLGELQGSVAVAGN